jgi:hypothetical protein
MEFNTELLLKVLKYLLLFIVLTYLIALIVMINDEGYDYRSKNIIDIIQDSFVFYIWSFFWIIYNTISK